MGQVQNQEDGVMDQQQDGDIRVLEALLFASAEPVSVEALRERLPANVDVGGLLMRLKEEYASRGINLVELEGHWAFRTAPDLSEALKVEKEYTRTLSKAAMETLSIVAYHQPVTRAEIENIRGVAVHRGTLDILIEAGWVKPGRRRESPGRPVTWKTTTAFLDHFGLESITDLPGLDELKASGLLDRRPAIESISMTGELFEEEDFEEELESDEETAYEEDDIDNVTDEEE